MDLIYQDNKISCYTDKEIRGNGIVNIQLLNNKFTILNLSGSIFEEFFFKDNEYTIKNNLKEIIARKVILNLDFFSLEFDCNEIIEDEEFIYIYLNSELKKIKKSNYLINYSTWNDYVKNSYVKILKDNLLIVKTDYGEKALSDSVNHTYRVESLLGDSLFLKTTSTGCCNCTENIEGFVKWKNNTELLVDICIID
ncbi:hypothetical protein FIA58_020905 [Flavobacterium jejuense]|uniref:Uncharacterized protein n=1 Tax=Flavobacterium jejuense TaxID=1544455 RepID=A0ABX0IW45_9FLAO|nr:hypothetical protein [Flavobacterium jejuense]NHN28145.1 hypothetical protein [Flavobacterium jejuense]